MRQTHGCPLREDRFRHGPISAEVISTEIAYSWDFVVYLQVVLISAAQNMTCLICTVNNFPYCVVCPLCPCIVLGLAL